MEVKIQMMIRRGPWLAQKIKADSYGDVEVVARILEDLQVNDEAAKSSMTIRPDLPYKEMLTATAARSLEDLQVNDKAAKCSMIVEPGRFYWNLTCLKPKITTS